MKEFQLRKYISYTREGIIYKKKNSLIDKFYPIIYPNHRIILQYYFLNVKWNFNTFFYIRKVSTSSVVNYKQIFSMKMFTSYERKMINVMDKSYPHLGIVYFLHPFSLKELFFGRTLKGEVFLEVKWFFFFWQEVRWNILINRENHLFKH